MQKVSKKVLFGVGGLFLGVVLSFGFLLIWRDDYFKDIRISEDNPEDVQEVNQRGDSTEEEQVSDKGEKTENESNKADDTSTRIDINESGYIDIPHGWHIVGLRAPYEDITEEMTEYLPCAESCFTGGVWPIHDKFEIVLQNDENEKILFGRDMPFIDGGYGGSAAGLGSDFQVIVKPVGGQGVTEPELGFARKEKGDAYEYVLIKKNIYYEPGSSDDLKRYKNLNVTKDSFLGFMKYEGSNDNLETVDEFFRKSCLENTSGICWDEPNKVLMSTR
jgi:hypothetical protein